MLAYLTSKLPAYTGSLEKTIVMFRAIAGQVSAAKDKKPFNLPQLLSVGLSYFGKHIHA